MILYKFLSKDSVDGAGFSDRPSPQDGALPLIPSQSPLSTSDFDTLVGQVRYDIRNMNAFHESGLFDDMEQHAWRALAKLGIRDLHTLFSAPRESIATLVPNELHGEIGVVLVRLGWNFRHLRDRNRSFCCFERAAVLKPNSYDILVNLLSDIGSLKPEFVQCTAPHASPMYRASSDELNRRYSVLRTELKQYLSEVLHDTPDKPLPIASLSGGTLKKYRMVLLALMRCSARIAEHNHNERRGSATEQDELVTEVDRTLLQLLLAFSLPYKGLRSFLEDSEHWAPRILADPGARRDIREMCFIMSRYCSWHQRGDSSILKLCSHAIEALKETGVPSPDQIQAHTGAPGENPATTDPTPESKRASPLSWQGMVQAEPPPQYDARSLRSLATGEFKSVSIPDLEVQAQQFLLQCAVLSRGKDSAVRVYLKHLEGAHLPSQGQSAVLERIVAVSLMKFAKSVSKSFERELSEKLQTLSDEARGIANSDRRELLPLLRLFGFFERAAKLLELS